MNCTPKPVRFVVGEDEVALAVGRIVHVLRAGVCIPAIVVTWDASDPSIIMCVAFGQPSVEGPARPLTASMFRATYDGTASTARTWHFPQRDMR